MIGMHLSLSLLSPSLSSLLPLSPSLLPFLPLFVVLGI
jgi:hypothetical protein